MASNPLFYQFLMVAAVPRDRNGSFAPQLVPKRQRRLAGFDTKVLSLYARGLSTREIQGHLAELYGTEVSPTLISTITDAVLDEVRTWQARPLASVYPILYFDALFVKSRQEGPVQTKAVYLALGITMDGEKERLSESEGAQILALRLHRAAQSWGDRLLYRMCRWTARAPRGDRGGVSQDAGAALYCA
jgi:transposase-like protein